MSGSRQSVDWATRKKSTDGCLGRWVQMHLRLVNAYEAGVLPRQAKDRQRAEGPDSVALLRHGGHAIAGGQPNRDAAHGIVVEGTRQGHLDLAGFNRPRKSLGESLREILAKRRE
jgi:hypothetical protein